MTLQSVSLIAVAFVLISTAGLLSLRKDPRFANENEDDFEPLRPRH
jgi:hypothetical protein